MLCFTLQAAFRRSMAAAARAAPVVVASVAAVAVPVLAAGSVSPPSAPALPAWGIPGTPHERTFVAIKPDGVQRGLLGEIIGRLERKGYKLVAIKMITPTKEMAAEHYGTPPIHTHQHQSHCYVIIITRGGHVLSAADLSSRPFFPGLVDFFSSGPIVAMVWEGSNAIRGVRTLMGTTNPYDSAPGSIRGDLCVITGRYAIHILSSFSTLLDCFTYV